MTSVPGTAFRAHLATLDRETTVTFAAAVYAARGWAVERDSDGAADLLATPPDADRPQRLVVRVGDGTTAPPDASHVVDAAALHEQVAYALPAAERTRLCRDFFDRDPESFGDDGDDRDATAHETATVRGADDGDDTAAPRDGESARPGAPASDDGGGETPPDDGRSTDTTDETEDPHQNAASDRETSADPDRSEWLGRVAVVGLALSLALGGIVTATGSSGVDIGSPAAVFGGNGTETATDESSAFPRGVDETGVTNAAALANAHEATLSNRSYRLTITYREFEDGELRGVATERALVASRDRYRSRVRRLGSLGHDATIVASGSTYANGSVGYIRTDDSVRKQTAIRSTIVASSTEADFVSFVDRTERTVQWYLSANETRIVGRTERNGTTTYRIAFEGDPWPESQNVTGRARVDGTGLVRELYRSYTPTIEPGVRIEVTIRIVPGPVTVTRPAWMAAANTTDDERAPVRSAPALTADATPSGPTAATTRRRSRVRSGP